VFSALRSPPQGDELQLLSKLHKVRRSDPMSFTLHRDSMPPLYLDWPAGARMFTPNGIRSGEPMWITGQPVVAAAVHRWSSTSGGMRCV
jgi:hypothetical protein